MPSWVSFKRLAGLGVEGDAAQRVEITFLICTCAGGMGFSDGYNSGMLTTGFHIFSNLTMGKVECGFLHGGSD